MVAIEERLKRLFDARDDIVQGAKDLRRRARDPDATRLSEELVERIVDWDKRYQDASDAINDLREATLPERSEQIDPGLQLELERAADRFEELKAWREKSYERSCAAFRSRSATPADRSCSAGGCFSFHPAMVREVPV